MKISEVKQALSFDLVTLGNVCVDVIVGIESFPINASKHQNLRHSVELSAGGSCNALIVASRLGLNVAPLDYIGNDSMGEFITLSLESSQISTEYLISDRNRNTLNCVILVDSFGNHTFIASNEQPTAHFDIKLASSNIIHTNCLLPSHQNAIANSKVLLIDGYALDELSFETIHEALAISALNSTRFWFDPQATTDHLVRTNPKLLDYLLSKANTLILTQEEIKEFFKASNESKVFENLHSVSDFFEVYQDLHCVVVKCGALGCDAYLRSTESVIHVDGVQLKESEIKDTAGAGDSFLAGFMTGLLETTFTIYDSMQLANAAGAASCMNSGTGMKLATLNQIQNCAEFYRNPVLNQFLKRIE